MAFSISLRYRYMTWQTTSFWPIRTHVGWFSSRTGTSFDYGKARGKDKRRLPVPNFATLPLAKPVVWFALAVVNGRLCSVAKSVVNRVTVWKCCSSCFVFCSLLSQKSPNRASIFGSNDPKMTWGPFLENPDNFSCPKSCFMFAVFAFKIKVLLILEWYNEPIS